MEEDFYEREIIYLKFMRFPDDNSIDYRMNGRPYLVFSINENEVCLLKISRSVGNPYFYYPIEIKHRGKKNKCYIDLRYIIRIDKEELISKVNSVSSENKAYKNSSKKKFISNKDYEEVSKKLQRIAIVKQIINYMDIQKI